jgi:hypothetical protein
MIYNPSLLKKLTQTILNGIPLFRLPLGRCCGPESIQGDNAMAHVWSRSVARQLKKAQVSALLVKPLRPKPLRQNLEHIL